MNIESLLSWIDSNALIEQVAEYLDEQALEEFENACNEGTADKPIFALTAHKARLQEFYRDQGLKPETVDYRAGARVSRLYRKFHALAADAAAA